MKQIPYIYLLTGCALIFLFGISCGSLWIPPEDWTSEGLSLIVHLRLVRMGGAFVIGGSLALSGLIFQAVLRNPLAEPFILGISGGSGVGAAVAILSGLSAGMSGIFAFAGALITLGFVLLVSNGGGRGETSLLLSGVTCGTVSGSILMYLLSTAHTDEIASITWWMLGNLQNVEEHQLLIPAVLLGFSLLTARYFAGELNLLSFGRSEAWNGGCNPEKLIPFLIVLASLLASLTVALAGIIGFTGLIIPHIVRKIYGADHRKITLPVVLCGGGFLMLCDILSRSLHPEREIQIGVITALIGGPLFLILLNRRGGK